MSWPSEALADWSFSGFSMEPLGLMALRLQGWEAERVPCSLGYVRPSCVSIAALQWNHLESNHEPFNP